MGNNTTKDSDATKAEAMSSTSEGNPDGELSRLPAIEEPEDIEEPDEGATVEANEGSTEAQSNDFQDQLLAETKLCLLERKVLALQLDLVDLQRRNPRQEATLLDQCALNRKLEIELADSICKHTICHGASLGMDADCHKLETMIKELQSNWPKADEARDWAQQFEGAMLSDIVPSEEERFDMMYHISKSGFAEAMAVKGELVVEKRQIQILMEILDLSAEKDIRSQSEIEKLRSVLPQWTKLEQLMANFEDIKEDLQTRALTMLLLEPKPMVDRPSANQKHSKEYKGSEKKAQSQAMAEASHKLVEKIMEELGFEWADKSGHHTETVSEEGIATGSMETDKEGNQDENGVDATESDQEAEGDLPDHLVARFDKLINDIDESRTTLSTWTKEMEKLAKGDILTASDQPATTHSEHATTPNGEPTTAANGVPPIVVHKAPALASATDAAAPLAQHESEVMKISSQIPERRKKRTPMDHR